MSKEAVNRFPFRRSWTACKCTYTWTVYETIVFGTPELKFIQTTFKDNIIFSFFCCRLDCEFPFTFLPNCQLFYSKTTYLIKKMNQPPLPSAPSNHLIKKNTLQSHTHTLSLDNIYWKKYYYIMGGWSVQSFISTARGWVGVVHEKRSGGVTKGDFRLPSNTRYHIIWRSHVCEVILTLTAQFYTL